MMRRTFLATIPRRLYLRHALRYPSKSHLERSRVTFAPLTTPNNSTFGRRALHDQSSSASNSSSSSSCIPEARVSPKRTPDNQQELWDAHLRQWQPKLQHALERYQDLQDDDFQQRTDVLTTLQECYHQLRYYEDAIAVDTLLLESLLKQQQRDHEHLAKLYMRLGNHCYHAKQFRNARQYLQKAIDTYREQLNDHDHNEIGTALHGIGLTYMYENDEERALEYLNQAEQHYKMQDNDDDDDADHDTTATAATGIAKVLSTQAMLYRQLFQPQQALLKYRELEDYIDRSDTQQKLQLDLDIGDCYADLNNHTQAQYYFESVINTIKEEEYPVGQEPGAEALARRKLGQEYIKLNRHEEALIELQRAHRITKRLVGDDNMDTAKCLNALGVCHAQMNNTGEALSYFREFLVIARMNSTGDEKDDMMVQNALKNIALVQKRDKGTRKSADSDKDVGGSLFS